MDELVEYLQELDIVIFDLGVEPRSCDNYLEEKYREYIDMTNTIYEEKAFKEGYRSAIVDMLIEIENRIPYKKM